VQTFSKLHFLMKILIIFFVMSSKLAFTQENSATEIVIIDQNFEKTGIGKNVYILEDPKNKFRIDDFLCDSLSSQFNKSEKNIPFFDYQFSTYWIKFTLKNSCKTDISLYFIVDYPLLYKIDFYRQTDSGVVASKAGDGYVFQQREIKTREPVFELDLKADSTETFYCRVESDGDVVSLPLYLSTKEKFAENASSQRIWLGLYYGILALIIIINLFFYINLSDRVYLIYILYVLMIGMFQFTREGLAFEFFWQNAPHWNNISVSVFSMLSVHFYLTLLRTWLETKKYFPKLNKVMLITAFTIPALLIPIFIPAYYRFIISFGNIVVAFAIVLITIAIISAVIKRHGFAKYFLVAIFFSIIGAAMLVMKNQGAGGIFQWEHGLKIGSALEMIILMYGLTVKFKKELTESQRQAVESLRTLTKMKEFENEKLEKLVKERTNEINQQKEELKATAEDLSRTNQSLLDRNEEINQQKEELLAQRNEIEYQKDILFSQKKQLTDSIQYAKRIQNAALEFDQSVKATDDFDVFRFFRPRDIVSGDFYKIYKTEDYNVFVAADCTGHGVPGGFLSILGIAVLNEIISKIQEPDPGLVLDLLRENIKSILHQTGERSESRDGMDIAVCFTDRKSLKLTYAGAHLPVHIYRTIDGENNLFELRGDKMPIGFLRRERPFVMQEFQLEPGDRLYMFSDGFSDQFGGKPPVKFRIARFKNLLDETATIPWNMQEQFIAEIFDNWKGEQEQVDDVMVMGVQFKNQVE